MTHKISFKFLLIFILFSIFHHLTFSQGCSDAGVCSINNFKPGIDSLEADKNNSVTLGFTNGKAAHSIFVYSSFIEYNRRFNKQIGTDIKLLFISENGNNFHSSGISDLFLSIKYSLPENLHFTLGAKIPFNDGNKKFNGIPLPMDYQYSLGTLDLILGAAYEYKNLKIVFALQQPLTQNNNKFLNENFPSNSIFREFHSTNKFIRSGDALLRLSYQMNISKRLIIIPNLLPVFHLTEDKFTDAFGQQMNISGSKGLTFNGSLYLVYAINKRSLLEFSYGAPFITRDAWPDGLKRSYVMTVEYIVKF